MLSFNESAGPRTAVCKYGGLYFALSCTVASTPERARIPVRLMFWKMYNRSQRMITHRRARGRARAGLACKLLLNCSRGGKVDMSTLSLTAKWPLNKAVNQTILFPPSCPSFCLPRVAIKPSTRLGNVRRFRFEAASLPNILLPCATVFPCYLWQRLGTEC